MRLAAHTWNGNKLITKKRLWRGDSSNRATKSFDLFPMYWCLEVLRSIHLHTDCVMNLPSHPSPRTMAARRRVVWKAAAKQLARIYYGLTHWLFSERTLNPRWCAITQRITNEAVVFVRCDCFFNGPAVNFSTYTAVCVDVTWCNHLSGNSSNSVLLTLPCVQIWTLLDLVWWRMWCL